MHARNSAQPVDASRTDTFLVRVTAGSPDAGAENAPVAVGRSVLVIVWHLLSDPQARNDLGADINGNRLSPNRKTRTHVRQLEALATT